MKTETNKREGDMHTRTHTARYKGHSETSSCVQLHLLIVAVLFICFSQNIVAVV